MSSEICLVVSEKWGKTEKGFYKSCILTVIILACDNPPFYLEYVTECKVEGLKRDIDRLPHDHGKQVL